MNFRFKVIFSFFFCLTAIIGKAQDITINTDRPDQTDAPATVPFKKFQVEEGVMISKESAVNNLMIRYGLTHSTEVRLLVDAGKEFQNKGLQPVTFSLKQRIIEQKNAIPAISFIGDVSAGPMASRDFYTREWPFALKFAFENDLSQKFSLGYNVGTSERFKNLDLTLNLGYVNTNKISTFIEYFSTINRLSAEHNVDAGILYLITPLLQVDVAFGRSVFSNDSRYFGTFGISCLFY